MTANPKITLEQWRALLAVVDEGGYAQAAEVLHKSQSAVTYAVQKLETMLGVKAFEIQGRKAILTPTGQLLYRRARVLLNEAGELEDTARAVSSGWEAEIGIAADVVFPSWLMVDCLARFGAESPHTRIEIYESVLSGTAELLLQQAPLLDNAGVQAYVNQVGRWVALNSERPDLPWRFGVLDSSVVGAYAAPGGYVFVTSGMLAQMGSEAELAGVLAHEVAHVV